jgi:hypothetical protein
MVSRFLPRKAGAAMEILCLWYRICLVHHFLVSTRRFTALIAGIRRPTWYCPPVTVSTQRISATPIQCPPLDPGKEPPTYSGHRELTTNQMLCATLKYTELYESHNVWSRGTWIDVASYRISSTHIGFVLIYLAVALVCVASIWFLSPTKKPNRRFDIPPP